MKAIIAQEQTADVTGLQLSDVPYPQATVHDVIVRVHAAGFTPGELAWPSTWYDRQGHDRTPSIPGHDVSGVVVEIGHGATGLTVGQRIFGLADFTRNGTLAEYAAIEARNLAPLPADVDHVTAAALPISGLTAWQGLFDHGHLAAGQTVLIHGVAGGVGSLAAQLAREVGARVVGTGRTADRDRAELLGVAAFIDLEHEHLVDAGEVDLVLDVIGGEVLAQSAALVRPGGRLVTITGPTDARPADGTTVFFVVQPDRAQLTSLVDRIRDGRLSVPSLSPQPLADALVAFHPNTRPRGKTIITVAP